jgi:CubicO group peptidase (beta-lactamase class C family)
MIGNLKNILIQGIEEGVFPGCVLLIGQKGRMVFLEWAGSLSYMPGADTIKKDTIFDLASLTKPLATGLAMMKLVNDNEIALDQPLPELLSKPIPNEKRLITPRLLLCHSAGLMDYQPFYLELEKVESKHRKAFLRDLILKSPLAYEPGQGCLYSDLGFMLLEWIIEERKGTDLAHFLDQHFYGPLGLKRTFLMEETLPPRYASNQFAATEDCPWRKQVMQGRTHDENAYALGGYSGHAGLFGTAEEAYRIADLLREHYYGMRQNYLRPEIVRDFFTKQNIVKDSTWALGWDSPSPQNSSAGRFFSRDSVGHLGFTGTSIWMDLEKDVIAILLTNRVHPTRQNEKIKQFRPRIHDAIMEELGFNSP